MKQGYTEEEILNAKNPMEFIDMCLNSSIPSGRKGRIARRWVIITGYTSDDINYARNRHPYWKEKKSDGIEERNKERLNHHNYSNGRGSLREPWPDEKIAQFLEFNKKDEEGEYLLNDYEMAKQMEISLASVQGWRRKYNLTEKILKVTGKNKTLRIMLAYLRIGETSLRKELKELERGLNE